MSLQPSGETFAEALALFHRYSLQNPRTIETMQRVGALPSAFSPDFAALDIGAGEGRLPVLFEPLVDTLVLLEPNPHCVERLRHRFRDVHAEPWGELAMRRLRVEYRAGFDLVSMSHMIYHFDGIDDIRAKIALAFALVKTDGHLVIVINQPDALTAQVGIAFQESEGRSGEARTNRDLHTFCHQASFYQDALGPNAVIGIHTIDAPLVGVPGRADLIRLLRMPLLDPGATGECDTGQLDAFIGRYLDATHPGLAYPADIPSRDQLIVIRRQG
mgnify:CR=1 FL=1